MSTHHADQLSLFEPPVAYTAMPPVPAHRTPRRTNAAATEAKALHAALAPHVDFVQLHALATSGGDVRQALRDTAPSQVQQLLTLMGTLLAAPNARLQVKAPADLAAVLMVEMSHLDQEQLRVVLLDTKNRVQVVHTVYQGSVNTAMIRVSEVFKEAIRQNAVAIIVAHNHPSGDPTPSPQDTLLTSSLVDAGRLLDIELLDHLVIGQGRWISMRERGLGFSS